MIISAQLIRSFDPKKQISDVVFATVLNQNSKKFMHRTIKEM